MVTRTVIVIQPLSSGALRFAAGQVIELPVIGTALTAPNGDALVVPTTATAASINVTAVTPGGSGFITVWPCGVARPLASNLNYVAGDVVPNGVLAPIGSNGKVCIYSLVDTDLVVDVAGWFEGDAFVGATPLRLRDTRETSRVTSAQELVLQVADIDASTADGSATRVPADVGAVALNVTVVSPDSAGFVTVYPCGTRPLASNVNYTAGQIVPNGVIAPVSANGEVCIYSLAPTDIIVDLAGWFPGDAFTAATPQRLVDTRDGTGGQQGKLIPTGQLNVPVHGQTLSVSGNSAQVPLSATAAALNVTIVNPERAGFATVWPCSAERPLASNLNFVSGQVVANNVIAPIGDQGSVCFYTNVPSDIIVDIAGYFSGEDGNQFVGSTPKRYIDTRSSLGPAPGFGDDTIKSYTWNFGDGDSSTEEVTSHIYTQAGSFEIALTVTNSDDLAHTTTQIVNTTLPTDPLVIGGTISVSSSVAVDSDVNDSGSTPVSNNTRATAQFVTNPVTIGGFANEAGTGPNFDGLSNLTESGDDFDGYRINALGGEIINLRIATRGQGDLDLFLYDNNGELIDFSVSATDNESIVIPAGVATYNIVVESFSGFSNYVLSVGQDPAIASLSNASASTEVFIGDLVVQAAKRSSNAPYARPA
jgi:PKD repeat protein